MVSRDSKGLFLPGESANPGGKPKGLREYIRERTNNGKDLLEIFISIAKGEPQRIPKTMKLAGGEIVELDLPTDALIPDMDQRHRAALYLADHFFGKAPDKIELTGNEGEPLFDPKKLPDGALAHYAALMAALAEREKNTIDVTPARKALPTP